MSRVPGASAVGPGCRRRLVQLALNQAARFSCPFLAGLNCGDAVAQVH